MHERLSRFLETAKSEWWLQTETELCVGSAVKLEWRVLQYLELPIQIVPFLKAATARLSEAYRHTAEELAENIADEIGSRTAGVPHVEILKRELTALFDLDLDSRTVEPRTSAFVVHVQDALATASPAFASGVALEFEATAIPELEFVAKMINELAEARGLAKPISFDAETLLKGKSADEISISEFFAAHIGVFEVDHQNHLADAITADLGDESELDEVLRGAEFCRNQLDAWFKSLL